MMRPFFIQKSQQWEDGKIHCVYTNETMPKKKKATPKSDFYVECLEKNLIFLSGNQFEIVGLLNSSDKELAGIEATREYDNFKEIRQDGTFTKSSGRKTKGNPVLKGKSKKGNYYIDPITNECVFSTYARILIKKVS